MKNGYRTWLGALAGLALPFAAHGANLLVETDPATFPLAGGALHLRVRPEACPSWTFGAGIYALDFPSLLVDLTPENKGEDWNVRIQPGIGIFTDRDFGEKNSHLTLGGQVGLQRFEVDATGRKGSDGFWNLLIMPRIGYHWAPFDNGFYLFPWAGLGYTKTVSGSTGQFHVAPLVPFATMHVGWEF